MTGAAGNTGRERRARPRGSLRALLSVDDPLSTADAIPHLCRVGGVVVLAIALSELLLEDRRAVLVASVPAASGVVLLLLARLLRGPLAGLLTRAPTALGVALALLVLANPLSYMALTQRTYPSAGMVLTIVGVGGLLASRPAALALVGAAGLSWVGLAAVHPPAAGWGELLVLVGESCALALVLHLARAATVRRLTQARAEVQRLSVTDELTGLRNRRGLREGAADLLGRARAGGRHAGVLVLDLDGLKAVNDAHGHDAGDRLLVRAAGVLRDALREDDVLARSGGDEFVAVLDRPADGDHAAVAARLAAALRAAGAPAAVGAAAVTGTGPEALAAALAAADTAMYAAKRAPSRRRADARAQP